MAKYGIRARDKSGVVIFDSTSKITKILGRGTTGTSNGSLQHPGFSRGTPFFSMFINGSNSSKQWPKLYVKNNRIYWDFVDSRYANAPVDFLFGIYI